MAECQSHLGRITRPRAFKIFGSQSAKPTKRRDVAYDGWRLRFRHSEKLLRGPTIAWRPLGVRGCRPSGLWLEGLGRVGISTMSRDGLGLAATVLALRSNGERRDRGMQPWRFSGTRTR